MLARRVPSLRRAAGASPTLPARWTCTAYPVLMTHGERHDGRTPDQLREIRITRNWLDHAAGSVLVEFGRTRVLCAASFSEGVPRWRKSTAT